MRAYSASDEEALRARDLLKDWAGEGFLTEAQHQHMDRETVCDLKRTNIFLRVVLFLFTVMMVGAAVGLFFAVFVKRPSGQTTGIILTGFAAVCYAAAEFAVSRLRLYRYGIEEALGACSVAFLFAGVRFVFFSDRPYSPQPHGMEFVVPCIGAIASLWIWHRFGFSWAFPGAMIFAIWLPRYGTSSHSAQHAILAALYAAGLIAVAAIRIRHRVTYLGDGFSMAEALLWLGIYLAVNLQLSSVTLLGQWWGGVRTAPEFSGRFYWTTWVLTWCLPPTVLARGLRQKDRYAIGVGAALAILTLLTNKPYLGWQRQSWDPIILGALLIGVALFIRRWLAEGPGGIRHGFTAQRLSGKDKQWIGAASAALGLLSPRVHMPGPQASEPNVRFGGGDSGGGGATSDF